MKLRGTIYNKDTDEELGGYNWRSSSSKIQRVKWEVAEISTWNVDLFKDVYSKMPMIQTLAIISKSNSKKDCMDCTGRCRALAWRWRWSEETYQ